jgi:hypothetical protein
MHEESLMTTERIPDTGQPIVEWFDEPYRLKDVKGDAVGDIVEVNAEFVVVEADRGVLGFGEQRTYYIPRTHIGREDATVWYLTIDKDEIEGLAFTSPRRTPDTPTGTVATATVPRRAARLHADGALRGGSRGPQGDPPGG